MTGKKKYEVSLSRTPMYKIIQARLYRRRKAGLITRKEQEDFYAALAREFYKAERERQLHFQEEKDFTFLSLMSWNQTKEGLQYWGNWHDLIYPRVEQKQKEGSK